MADETLNSEAASAPQNKIIKRYSNRKLYDTERSKYVTLEEISKMIQEGEHVRIIDNKSKSDLTSATLAQIIFEGEKKQSKMPLSMLRNLIQSSGDAIGDFFENSVKNPVENAKNSAQRTAEEIVQGAAQLREAANRGMTEFTTTARRVFGRGETPAVDERIDMIAARYDAAFAEIKERIELQIKEAPQDGPKIVQPLIERLSTRLEELKIQLAELHEASLMTADDLAAASPAETPATAETPAAAAPSPTGDALPHDGVTEA